MAGTLNCLVPASTLGWAWPDPVAPGNAGYENFNFPFGFVLILYILILYI